MTNSTGCNQELESSDRCIRKAMGIPVAFTDIFDSEHVPGTYEIYAEEAYWFYVVGDDPDNIVEYLSFGDMWLCKFAFHKRFKSRLPNHYFSPMAPSSVGYDVHQYRQSELDTRTLLRICDHVATHLNNRNRGVWAWTDADNPGRVFLYRQYPSQNCTAYPWKLRREDLSPGNNKSVPPCVRSITRGSKVPRSLRSRWKPAQ